MKRERTIGLLGTILTAIALNSAVANETAAVKSAVKPTAFWTVQKETGKLMLLIPGQKDPVATAVSDATVFGGICLDCNLPLEFKTGEAAKNCNVCGCAVSNAACIVGKAVKSNTWQAMLKTLPSGTGLLPTFNEADKPESGVKKLMVSLRSLLLPVSGLDTQTPDQLLALVKPLGASSAELLDGGKLLQITMKSDWTFERAAKLQKSLQNINAKVLVPEEPKLAQ